MIQSMGTGTALGKDLTHHHINKKSPERGFIFRKEYLNQTAAVAVAVSAVVVVSNRHAD